MSYAYGYVFFSLHGRMFQLRMRVASLRMQMRASMHMLALKDPILTFQTPFSLIFSSDYHFNALFHHFVGLACFLK